MRMDEAILNGKQMYPDTVYAPDTYKYLSLDGKRAAALGFAALGVGFTPEQFRAVLNKGIEDAFVYTLRSEIWFCLHQVWPWLVNDHFQKLAQAEETGGLNAVLDWLRANQPKEDDQLPLPVLPPVVYPQAQLVEPVVPFTAEQTKFIGRALHTALFNDDQQELPVIEAMASQFEQHVPGFDPNYFYNEEEKTA